MEWRKYFKESNINGGQDYVGSGSVKEYQDIGNTISAVIDGIEPYQVYISYLNDEITNMKCNCQYGINGYSCKHMAAVLLTYEEKENEKKNCAPVTEIRDSITDESVNDDKENVPQELEMNNPVPRENEIANSDSKDSVEHRGEETAIGESGSVKESFDERITMSVDVDDVVNYAISHNGVEIVREVIIKNNTDNELEHLTLTIKTENDLIVPFEFIIDKVREDEELRLNKLKVRINGNYLASLTERINSTITFSLISKDGVISSAEKEITALAFDEWAGLKYTPEFLAAFSMPNHPVVINLIQEASKYLKTWTGDPSLDGYQSGDPNRVKYMAASAYAAIQKKNIIYANPPSSFEKVGQRIRLADAMLDQHLGTCLDMTLLYVACLEAMGLNPFLVLIQGHIFAGVWLIEESFSDTIMDDPSNIEKRMSNGINELIVVECTAMNAGRVLDFDMAISAAKKNVKNYSKFSFAVDITRARSMGIIPLPIRVKTKDGYTVKHEERKETDVTGAPVDIGINYDLSAIDKDEKPNKQSQWERKLLDLSLRNMLINLRFTKAVVPILCNNVGELEDNLTEGEEFHVLPRPDNMEINGDGSVIEALSDIGPFKEFIELQGKHKKLHSLYTEKELSTCLTKMYRSAKSSMEENGANTLYLALGLLRWVETGKDKSPRYAPIILIPIDIIRKSANKGYSMRMRDEDAQLNITLLEFLKQNFDLRVVGLDPLPTDEHGLDIPKIFAILRHNVLSMPMWDVVEAAFISNFSFSQFVMWNDIHNHVDILEKNKIVRSLMKGAIDWDASVKESDYTDEAYLPITADGSQIRAINMAANDVSFVLHGPPGTGKSQTITAMIANALTKGKKVLFVAEKMAALEVVQKRLAALGIDDFCLELHSNKATKKAVLDQLRKNLEIGTWGSETEYDQRIKDIRSMRASLDSYAIKLHAQRPFGKSLKELIDLYENIPDYGVELRFTTSYAQRITRTVLDKQKRLIEQLVATGKGIGHPHNHPLSIVGQTVYTQSLKLELRETLEEYKNALNGITGVTTSYVSLFGLGLPTSESEWRGLYELANSIVLSESIPQIFLESENIDKDFYEPLSYKSEMDSYIQKRNQLLGNWKEPFLSMNMSVYRSRYEEANNKVFGKKAMNNLVSEIQSFALFSVVQNQIPVILADIEAFQKQGYSLELHRKQISFEWLQLVDRFADCNGLKKYKAYIENSLNSISQYYSYIQYISKLGRMKEALTIAKQYIQEMDAVKAKEEKTVELLQLSFTDLSDNWINDRIQQCDTILNNAHDIKDWIVFKQIEKECREADLDVVCDVYMTGIPHDQLMSIYLRSVYKAIILSVIETEPALNSFTGNGFNEKIVQFKNLDSEFMELTKEEMYYKLTHQLPTDLQSVQISKELNILRRAISSNGRGVTIRSLFEQIPNILSRLCPCMLMSPISVAQYITMNPDMFDIVIFDEASQLPTCKAVGVLARGKNAVIVGDPNQMPPTSFFAGNTVDEDNLDIEDLDSILDDCLALGMPSAHLQWHYRSRHESLIAFSNHEFYENSMLTFPSMNDLERKVYYVKVDSFYDRKKGRVNEGEAKAVVEELKRRYNDEFLKNESVGVVTFNVSQQTLIEDMLQDEFQKDSEFDRWANSGNEPLFVKNLENVQGDERDIILFSIAYGPDETGKLSHNFGPLNKDGGWKRLNVAVSRARDEMMVFSSFTSDMIDLRRTKAKGVESLKKFLEFAEKGELHLSYSETHIKKNQGILGRICKELDEAGYEYQISVGHSKFKIDIAVINPYNKDEFILGIMLDGDSYRQSSNTKDREVSQFGVLKGLGWKLHRMWTMDWWDNKEKEIQKLLSILADEKEHAQQVSETSINPKQSHNAEEQFDNETLELDSHQIKESAEESGINEIKEGTTGNEQVLRIVDDDRPGEYQMHDSGVTSKMLLYEDNTSRNEKVASGTSDNVSVVEEKTAIKEKPKEYRIEDYKSSVISISPLSTSEYTNKEHYSEVLNRLQLIIDLEAPISIDVLIKKVLRSFDISRVSSITQEYTEKVIKKTESKSYKQNGKKYIWRTDQDPNSYDVFRVDENSSDRRNVSEICNQEIKNAICLTLLEKGTLSREELIKATAKTMGYSRSGPAIVEAVDQGIKYARKTGEIIVNEDTKLELAK